MSTQLTFKEYMDYALREGQNDHCNFIKDPVLRRACKKLNKKSPGGVRMYGTLSGGTTAGAPAGGAMSGGGGD